MAEPHLNVVQFPPRCGDVSAMLRQLADDVDAGEYGDEARVVIVVDGTPFSVRGYGKVDGLQAVGLLQLGIAHIVNSTLDELECE